MMQRVFAPISRNCRHAVPMAGEMRNTTSKPFSSRNFLKERTRTSCSKISSPYASQVLASECQSPWGVSNHKKLKYSKKRWRQGEHSRKEWQETAYLPDGYRGQGREYKETPQDALQQAIEYGRFLRELLRSKSGEKWWRLFEFNRAIPKNLTIRCACVVPDDIPDKRFLGNENGYKINSESQMI
jgi:hypothetical protein